MVTFILFISNSCAKWCRCDVIFTSGQHPSQWRQWPVKHSTELGSEALLILSKDLEKQKQTDSDTTPCPPALQPECAEQILSGGLGLCRGHQLLQGLSFPFPHCCRRRGFLRLHGVERRAAAAGILDEVIHRCLVGTGRSFWRRWHRRHSCTGKVQNLKETVGHISLYT